MKPMRRNIMWVAIALLSVIVALVLWDRYIYPNKVRNDFLAHWQSQLSTCTTIDQVKSLARPGGEYLTTYSFPNGEWVVTVVRPSCTDHYPPDVTVIHDSTGATSVIYDHHICAIEGSCEFDRINPANLEDFYKTISFMNPIKTGGQQGGPGYPPQGVGSPDP